MTIPPYYTTASKTHVNKTTDVPVFSIELILNDFEAGKSITWAIGRGGPWKSRLFLARCYSRPQKSLDFQGPTLPMALEMDIARLKIIIYRAI